MKASGVLETVLYAEDLDAAEAFYGGVLGLEKVARHPTRQVFFRCGDAMLLIFNPVETRKQPRTGERAIPGHGPDGPGHVCFCATGAEIEDWREHLIAAGVGIESEIDWPQGGHSIYFRDPAGNSLEFAEPRMWGLT